jgi:small conductance mechanosensitive channel
MIVKYRAKLHKLFGSSNTGRTLICCKNFRENFDYNNIFALVNLLFMEWIIEDIIKIAIRFGVSILILIVGFWLGNVLKGFLRRRMEKRNVEPTIRNFIIPVLDVLFKILVIITSIGVVGLHITSFAAVLGGLAIGVGMAMQGSLSNFAGGILIILFKPFKVGDSIEAMGHSGRVEAISILYTTLVTDDRKVVVLPNATLLNNPVVNGSIKNTRRIVINFSLTYKNDLEKCKRVILTLLEADPGILKNESTVVEVVDYQHSGVLMAVKAFANREEHSEVSNRLKYQLKEVLDAEKIDFSFQTNQLIVASPSGTSEA